MTEEHLPQRSVGNDREIAMYRDPVSRDTESLLGIWFDGFTRPTLCQACNARASDFGYVREYKAWFDFIFEQGKTLAQELQRDPFKTELAVELVIPYDRMPGRFIRQVIGNFLASQDSPVLMADHPGLATLIGPGIPDATRPHAPVDVSPIRIYFGVANCNWVFQTAPGVQFTTRLNGRTDSGIILPPEVLESVIALTVIVSPFAFVLADGDLQGLGDFRIDHWAQLDEHARLKRTERTMRVPTFASWTGPIAAAVRQFGVAGLS
jgi:hypothetical protein